MECGTRLSWNCPGCGSNNPGAASVCTQCGVALAASSHPQPASTPAVSLQTTTSERERLVGQAERRQLTVMFCDLVGSTPLSEKLDPEEFHGVMEAYQNVCSEVVLAFGGHIAKYLGDGIVVFFGYPLAHEDDAQRAVRAAIRISKQVPQLEPILQDKHRVRLSVRVGIHTGLVVAGELGVGDRRAVDIVGETPNLAARLQEVAQPDTVVISASTHRLISREFEVQSIGERTLKGLTRPMEVFQVLAERDPQAMKSLQLDSQRLVGRERELNLLLGRWETAEAGIGQVVLLTADPGVGKTRLALELQWNISNKTAVHIVEVRCSAYYQSSPFYPVIEVLQRQILGFIRDESAENKLHRLEAYCEALDLPLPDTIPILARLLSLSLQARYAPPNLSPEGLRQRTLELVVEIVMRRAGQQPLLLMIENAHWTDPSTLEVLKLIIEKSANARMLLLITFRPIFVWPSPLPENVLQISLDRLDDSQAASIIAQIAGSSRLPDQVTQQIISKTDGVPLFVEELTKMVLESDILVQTGGDYTLKAASSDLTIPTTLQDSLMARLDRLSTVKEIAQMAAVIGREFVCGMLMAITQLEEPTLRRELGRLVDAGLLYEVEDPNGSISYRFKHALIQDAAYNSLLISRRQQYHREIAEIIEQTFPLIAEGQPELVASHYTAAGMAAPAITFWIKAGQQALARSANQEAIADFSRVLELLKSLPETPETLQIELVAQASLGIASSSVKGFGASEAGVAFSRAAVLCEIFGETPQLFPVLWGLWAFYLVRDELETAQTTAEQLLRMGEAAGDVGLLLEGHFTLGNTLFWRGELQDARQHLEKALELYDSELHRSHALIYGQDPGVICHCYLGYTLWHLGLPDAAMASVRQALALSHETGHPFSTGWALGFCSVVSQWRRDFSEAKVMSEATINYCSEQGHAFWLAAGTFVRGWARFAEGDLAAGIDQMRHGLALYQATGSEIVQPIFLGNLAESLGVTGEAEEALQILRLGIAKAQAHGELISELDLHRLEGQLLLLQDPSNRAISEDRFRYGIKFARRHGAKSCELLASMSLCRSLKDTGRTAEALPLLQGIYDQFTEGFDTQDLKDAKTLLEELKDG